MTDWIDELSLHLWNSLEEGDKRGQARAIGKKCGAKFEKIEEFKRGDQKCSVALFSKDKAIFGFIPGGVVELGYRDNQKVVLPDEECEKWLESLLDNGAIVEGESITHYLKSVLTEQRRVNLRPYLIELEPRFAEIYYDEAEDADDLTCHEIIVKALDERGYCLATSDQWEWAYSGGAEDLFPWGNRPLRDPKLEKNFGSAALQVAAEPNAFGLHLNVDPYKCECTEEEMIMRAGDGGTRVCGAMYDTFITQASSYFEDISETDAIAEYYETALVRRVISL